MNFLKKFKKEEKESPNKQLIDGVVASSKESQSDPQDASGGELDATDMAEDMPEDTSSDELAPEMGDLEDEGAEPQFEDSAEMDQSLEDDGQDMEGDGFSSEDDQMPDQEISDEEMSYEDQDPEMDDGFEDHEQPGDMIYMAGDGDAIGAQVGQAVLHDDEQALHEISNAINDGQEMIIEWTENNGGTVISAGGDEFVVILPSELQDQLEDLREAYSQVVGATLTIGLGQSMSEAGKALIYGKLNGKNQIAQFDPSMDSFLNEVQGQKPSDEEKYNEHYLDSVYGDEQGGLPEGQEGIQPTEKIEEEQVAELPEPGDMQKDEQSLRDKMLTVVESFRSEQETINATKDQNPELYQAFMATISAMIDLARKMGPSAEAPQQEEVPPEQADMAQPIQQPEDPSMGEPQG